MSNLSTDENIYVNQKGKVSTFLMILLCITGVAMLIPFAWMLSASLKLDKDVFSFPIQWIPKEPRWQNYADIWTKIPLGKFVYNTREFRI